MKHKQDDLQQKHLSLVIISCCKGTYVLTLCGIPLWFCMTAKPTDGTATHRCMRRRYSTLHPSWIRGPQWHHSGPKGWWGQWGRFSVSWDGFFEARAKIKFGDAGPSLCNRVWRGRWFVRCDHRLQTLHGVKPRVAVSDSLNPGAGFKRDGRHWESFFFGNFQHSGAHGA